MKAIALLALVVIGCGTVEVVNSPPTDDQLADELWLEAFDAPGFAPYVSWLDPSKLEEECDFAGWLNDDGWCVDGETIDEGWVVVARWEGAELWETALAHEFGHAADLRNGMLGPDVDPHQTANFLPGGGVGHGEAWLRDLLVSEN